MLAFKKIEIEDADTLREYYSSCTYGLCDYSAGTMMMWKPLRAEYALAAGCLIVRVYDGEKMYFHYPVPGPNGDEDAALSELESYCIKKGISLSFSVVPKEKLAHIAERYPFCRIGGIRAWQDYIYRMEDMCSFAGRHYSGQRNHINKFCSSYPTAHFCVLTAADAPRLESFFEEYRSTLSEEETGRAEELLYTKELFRLLGRPDFPAGGIELEGKLIAVSMAEICGDMLLVHSEKALYQYEGVYPTLVREFANAFGEDLRWCNREDDAAEKGLRTSKLQYRPAYMGEKYRVDIENEAFYLKTIPEIKTGRLTLRAFQEQDIAAYQALCLDDAWNRYWGYDYRDDLHEELTERYFFEVQERDFARRLAVNFAITLEDRCIGEAIVYTFDMRGGAELGLRLLRDYSGHGYGREAFRALKDWALYSLGLRLARAKCYHENVASEKMLSSCMRPAGADETFLYFEAIV